MNSPFSLLTIASRDTSTSFEAVQEAVRNALQSLANATIIREDPDIGVVIAQVPDSEVNQFRDSLGTNFMVDPNSSLNLL